MFNQLQIPRFSSIIRKVCRIQEEAPLPQLQGELTPTICLEHERPEWAYLGEDRLLTGCTYRSALAANYAHIMLHNPSGSGVIATINRMLFGTDSGTFIRFGFTQTETATWTSVTTEAVRDSREANRGPLHVLHKNHTGMYVTDYGLGFQNWAAGNVQLEVPVVLTPGYQFTVVAASTNVALSGFFAWRERALAPDES